MPTERRGLLIKLSGELPPYTSFVRDRALGWSVKQYLPILGIVPDSKRGKYHIVGHENLW